MAFGHVVHFTVGGEHLSLPESHKGARAEICEETLPGPGCNLYDEAHN